MSRRSRINSSVLLALVAAAGSGLASWKYLAVEEANALSAEEPVQIESVRAAQARVRDHRAMTTAIGTVLALRSITLRNELPGTVRDVSLTPGTVVEAGALLVALDVSVEQAELQALSARAALAETLFERARKLAAERAISEEELDKTRAERDVAHAEVDRVRAVIARKTIRAPFRARVGLADLHPGQYLNEGSVLTTLQGVDDAVHVDFSVPQHVAAALVIGEPVRVSTARGAPAVHAAIVAVDARVDPTTRNAAVRARVDDGAAAPSPGASVRIDVPSGPIEPVITVPATALRKGPAGDHVFVLDRDENGHARARIRAVESGPLLGDDVVIRRGLAAGELVAASGSFKLYDSALVAVAADPPRLLENTASVEDGVRRSGNARSVAF
jgi:membrane fusion protein, multidrug efflux system